MPPTDPFVPCLSPQPTRREHRGSTKPHTAAQAPPSQQTHNGCEHPPACPSTTTPQYTRDPPPAAHHTPSSQTSTAKAHQTIRLTEADSPPPEPPFGLLPCSLRVIHARHPPARHLPALAQQNQDAKTEINQRRERKGGREQQI